MSNTQLHELAPGTRYVLANSAGPYTRGETDPKDLPRDAEVFLVPEIPAPLPQNFPKGATVELPTQPKGIYMKQASNNDRPALSLIQEARHTAEELVRYGDTLPASLIKTQLGHAKRNLADGLAKLETEPAACRGSELIADMAARASDAIATLEAK